MSFRLCGTLENCQRVNLRTKLLHLLHELVQEKNTHDEEMGGKYATYYSSHKYLQTMVTRISHDDVTVTVDGDAAAGAVEMSVA